MGLQGGPTGCGVGVMADGEAEGKNLEKLQPAEVIRVLE